MSNLGELFSDDYNFETLVVPAMVLAIPIMIVLALCGLNINAVVGFVVLGVQLLLFPLWLMTSWIRNRGKAVEARLFADGQPTHTSLRLSGQDDYDTRTRRQRLETATGVMLAALPQEQADKADADARIRDAMGIAREKMRDPVKFKLLRRELKSYGYWRNMAGVRNLGIATTIVCGVISGGALIFADGKKLPLTGLACAAAMFFFWLIAVGDKQVVKAADRYKNQFFNSLTTL